MWDGTAKDIAKFDAVLWAPPDDVHEDGDDWSDDDALDEFTSALGELRSLARSSPVAD